MTHPTPTIDSHTHNAALSRRDFVTMMSAAVAGTVLTQAMPHPAYADDDRYIAIVHTNDVHCNIDPASKEGTQTNVGYAGVATVYKQAQADYGAANTLLVDAGDYASGMSAGTLTKGGALINLMNSAGYAAATLGNHDFDFGMDVTKRLIEASKFDVVSCNFYSTETGERVCNPYTIKEVAGKKVALLGITTPETLWQGNPSAFKDEEGNFIYTFKGDDTGEALYTCIQESVDAARKEGAGYVIALAHLGQKGMTERWRSDTVVRNTSGIDAVIDGHSHETYTQTVTNKEGKAVPITQTGTSLTAVGRLVIDTMTNEITTELVSPPIDADPEMAEAVKKIDDQLSKYRKQRVGSTSYFLLGAKSESYEWFARNHDTNLGDLVADTYRWKLESDITLLNGGSLRTCIEAGDITYGSLLDVTPFSKYLSMVRATGQTIIDALELGARLYPNPSGAFLQASGLTYEIRTDIASTVETNEKGEFVRVSGQRRVQNVRIGGEPIDLERRYTVSSTDYILMSYGDGYTMWKDAEVIVSQGSMDYQATADYFTEVLPDGIVPDSYADAGGQGRIVFKDGPDPTPTPTPSPSPSSDAGDSSDASAAAHTGDNATIASAIAVSGTAAAAIVAGIAKAAGGADSTGGAGGNTTSGNTRE